MGVGRGKGGRRPPWVLKMSTKNGYFFSFEWEKTYFTTFVPLENFGKIPQCPPWKKNSYARVVDLFQIISFYEYPDFT